MLSSKGLVYDSVAKLLIRDTDILPPKMEKRVIAFLLAANSAGHEVVINETGRTGTVQELYYTLGRGVPNSEIVTYAKLPTFSWHGFLLAIDVRHGRLGYFNVPAAELKNKTAQQIKDLKAIWFQRGEDWIHAVAAIARDSGLDAGLDWKKPDKPHFQWDGLKPSPSDRARQLLAEGGILAVYEEVGVLY